VEIRARGRCETQVSGQRSEPIEIGGSDTRDRDLDGLAAGLAKLSEQSAQRTARQAISMRVGQNHPSSSGA
jgi:hypothetical protein